MWWHDRRDYYSNSNRHVHERPDAHSEPDASTDRDTRSC
jgi:hypothetical protein